MKSHYFDHDYSARNDQKILRLRARHGWEGYGIYWAILETMAEDSTGYLDGGAIEGLSAGYGVAIDRLKAIISNCIEIGLFAENDDGSFYSKRMIEHKRNMIDFTENGRIGAKKRWGNRGANGGAIEGVMQSRVDKSILKEIKEDKTKDKTVRFTAPTVDDVKAYCLERKNSIDPIRFHSYYESNGWKVGRNPMRSWKAAVVTWEKGDNNRTQPRLAFGPQPLTRELLESQYAMLAAKEVTP